MEYRDLLWGALLSDQQKDDAVIMHSFMTGYGSTVIVYHLVMTNIPMENHNF